MKMCHKYYEFKPIPNGSQSLLGLGLKFCPMRPRPTNNLDNTIQKFKTNVRQIAFFKNLKQKASDDSEEIPYIPSLYIKIDKLTPPRVNKVIKKSLNDNKKTHEPTVRLPKEKAKLRHDPPLV